MWVEIQSTEDAFYLLYLDERGECMTDTWHQTAEQAKAQAHFAVSSFQSASSMPNSNA